jgi:hypothetical protein
MGIHEPKNRDEADFARRRLIFDDFFYLQVSLYIPDINLEVVASYGSVNHLSQMSCFLVLHGIWILHLLLLKKKSSFQHFSFIKLPLYSNLLMVPSLQDLLVPVWKFQYNLYACSVGNLLEEA